MSSYVLRNQTRTYRRMRVSVNLEHTSCGLAATANSCVRSRDQVEPPLRRQVEPPDALLMVQLQLSTPKAASPQL